MVEATFKPGDRVTKTKGSNWTGRVVGTCSTALTPEGYAVESETEKGSVQIYPAAALSPAPALPESGVNLRIEFHQHDWIPGFAAFVPDATSPAPESKAFCVLNLGSLLAAVEDGTVAKSEVPYLVAETMMHEVMHALEQWASAEFNEDRIETILHKYRSAAPAPAPMDGELAAMERSDRSDFERWARKTALPLHMAESGLSRFYADDRTEWAWQGWIAAEPAPALPESGVEAVRELMAKLDEARLSIWDSYRHLAARDVAKLNDVYDGLAALTTPAPAPAPAPAPVDAAGLVARLWQLCVVTADETVCEAASALAAAAEREAAQVRDRERWEAVAEAAWSQLDAEVTKALCETIGGRSETPPHVAFYNALQAAEARVTAAEAERDKLREAALQCLDDMGATGRSVCGLAKAELRWALGPMDGDEEAPVYSYDEALEVMIACDEQHGKPSGHRVEQRARAAIRKETT